MSNEAFGAATVPFVRIGIAQGRHPILDRDAYRVSTNKQPTEGCQL